MLAVFHAECGLRMAAVMHGLILCRVSVVELQHPQTWEGTNPPLILPV